MNELNKTKLKYIIIWIGFSLFIISRGSYYSFSSLFLQIIGAGIGIFLVYKFGNKNKEESEEDEKTLEQ